MSSLTSSDLLASQWLEKASLLDPEFRCTHGWNSHDAISPPLSISSLHTRTLTHIQTRSPSPRQLINLSDPCHR